MKQLPITTAEIHVIPVPAATKNIRMRFGRYLTMVKPFSSSVDQFDEPGWELLGTCTKDDIDFDAALIVDIVNKHYRNYTWPLTGAEDWDWCETDANTSLRSAIEASGYYFENPLGNRPVPDDYDDWDYGNSAYKNWVAAQQSVVDKLVIIKKV